MKIYSKEGLCDDSKVGLFVTVCLQTNSNTSVHEDFTLCAIPDLVGFRKSPFGLSTIWAEEQAGTTTATGLIHQQ